MSHGVLWARADEIDGPWPKMGKQYLLNVAF